MFFVLLETRGEGKQYRKGGRRRKSELKGPFFGFLDFLSGKDIPFDPIWCLDQRLIRQQPMVSVIFQCKASIFFKVGLPKFEATQIGGYPLVI